MKVESKLFFDRDCVHWVATQPRRNQTMSSRNYSPFDHVLLNVDQALRTVFGRPQSTGRADPARAAADHPLSDQEKQHSAGLMRVNHVGEVCAQALYQGQALTARTATVREAMQAAAREENDHLDWCEARVKALDSHLSYLNPLWYAGAFGIGAVAGAAGDQWSLGFVAETERQVARHLERHLRELPSQDHKSRAVLEQMHADESKHATTAMEAGGRELPAPIRGLMKLASKVMTVTAYRI